MLPDVETFKQNFLNSYQTAIIFYSSLTYGPEDGPVVGRLFDKHRICKVAHLYVFVRGSSGCMTL